MMCMRTCGEVFFVLFFYLPEIVFMTGHLICFLSDKLDGIRLMKGKRKRQESPPLHLSDDDDDPYDEREEDMRIGKKRVSHV